ncbi:hypothetical protein AVEN_170918-1 [Araneus ventricosus]|uniref:Uncharacterized protein n=1 Tax=Araneus ventricosus TaxID=182803 RepID=A0A4Y2JC81_ARAVE|nr:hypothetical protein AVEN_170918-1 [Araneus ventricosus]
MTCVIVANAVQSSARAASDSKGCSLPISSHLILQFLLRKSELRALLVPITQESRLTIEHKRSAVRDGRLCAADDIPYLYSSTPFTMSARKATRTTKRTKTDEKQNCLMAPDLD